MKLDVASDDAGTVRPVPGAASQRSAARARLTFLAMAFVALLAGLDAALLLLGLPAPVTGERLPAVHGPLLVIGFVGTLVALERAVALRKPAGFAAPGLFGLGALLLLSPAPLRWGQATLVLGCAALAVLYVPLWRRQQDDAVLIQALAAVLATGGAILWLGGLDVARLLPWLVGFVVLTIGGERLELARITMGPTAGRDLVRLSGLLSAAITATALWDVSYPVLGLALLALIGWLARHDAARRTIRSVGLPRFTAGCLLAGYAWLAVAGALWTTAGAAFDGPRYDAIVHACFLGFTMSMILAHAPIILPAILRRPLPYHPAMIGPAALLHASLALRLWIGDGLGWLPGWQIGGVLNIVALLGFMGVGLWSALRGRHA